MFWARGRRATPTMATTPCLGAHSLCAEHPGGTKAHLQHDDNDDAEANHTAQILQQYTAPYISPTIALYTLYHRI